MEEALVIFSRQGLFKRKIHASDIRSREHARKLWPLVTPMTPYELVGWVSPSFKEHRRKAYFRRPREGSSVQSMTDILTTMEGERQRKVGESPEHQKAKALLQAELQRLIDNGIPMRWRFKDSNVSDLALSGNLLLGATAAIQEHPITTPFGLSYRLDIAIVGAPISSQELILGGIEIELSHPFEGRKAMISKTQGFPLISVDISDMVLEEITPEWASHILELTTTDDPDGRRKSYVYLHDLLYPLYLVRPPYLMGKYHEKHQYHAFANDESLDQLRKWIQRLKEKLELSDGDVSTSLVKNSSDSSTKSLLTAGAIVGPDWQMFNDHQFLRITLRLPTEDDLRLYLLHITIARLLLSERPSLVGYQYRNGEANTAPEEDLWVCTRLIDKQLETIRILPKRLAEPVTRIMAVLDSLASQR